MSITSHKILFLISSGHSNLAWFHVLQMNSEYFAINLGELSWKISFYNAKKCKKLMTLCQIRWSFYWDGGIFISPLCVILLLWVADCFSFNFYWSYLITVTFHSSNSLFIVSCRWSASPHERAGYIQRNFLWFRDMCKIWANCSATLYFNCFLLGT